MAAPWMSWSAKLRLDLAEDEAVFPLTEYNLTRPPTRGAGNITSENKDQLLESEKVVGCSDLSVDPLEGAAAYSWVLTNETESGRIHNQNRACPNQPQ